jgi:hypothetical protein
MSVRSIVAIAVGVMIAMVMYGIGAVIAELSMHGLQLNSPGGPPTTGDILAHIVSAAAGSYCGARLALLIARRSPALHAGAFTLVLAVVAILGFGNVTNNWPSWFGFAIAAAFAGGALAAALAPGAASPAA